MPEEQYAKLMMTVKLIETEVMMTVLLTEACEVMMIDGGIVIGY